MTKIAIISDIHSNLPAFEAVLADIRKKDIQTIYSLGDLIGKGPNPKEVIQLCQKNCTLSILGNWEDFLLHSGVREQPINYYRNQLSSLEIDYLSTLAYGIESYISGKLIRFFHAHPFSVYDRVFIKNEKLFEYANPDLIAGMFMYNPDCKDYKIDKVADIAIYGDIHYSFDIQITKTLLQKEILRVSEKKGITEKEYISKYYDSLKILENKRICNVGSVGQPFDGTNASYAIITGDFENKDSLNISVQKVEYDLEKAATYGRNSTMVDKEEYVEEILTGIFRGLR